jgi:hypothetical protein
MTMMLRVVLMVFSATFFVAVIRMVARDRLQLKYSLLWLLMSVLLMLSALFPNIVSGLAHALGFELTSNFVFMAGFVFLVVTCLSLSVIVSWQARDIRSLVQQVALLRKELEEHAEGEGRHATNVEQL